MEVNGSILRASVFMTPEPSILVSSPPVVMQSPHSDQLQAVSRSRKDKAAAIRNMTRSSNMVQPLNWHSATATRYALVGDVFLFDRARAGNSRLEFWRADIPDACGA